MLTNIHLFFTTWLFMLIVFAKYTHKYIDLHFLSLLVLCIGLFMSFVTPRKYVIVLQNKEYAFSSWNRLLCIDVLHLLMFCIVYLYVPYRFTLDKYVAAIIMFLFYFLIVDTNKVYNVSNLIGFSLVLCITIIYTIYKFLYV